MPFQCPQVLLTSVASGSWGYNAFWDSHWLQVEWTPQMRSLSITFMEVLLILLAAVVWGPRWRSCRVICHCENKATVSVVNKRSAKDPRLAQLLRGISFYSIYFHFSLHAQHVSGHHNQSANALSLNNLHLFFSLCPQAQPTSEPIPYEVIKMALLTKVDWISPVWRALFRATLPKDYPSQQLKPTSLHNTNI